MDNQSVDALRFENGTFEKIPQPNNPGKAIGTFNHVPNSRIIRIKGIWIQRKRAEKIERDALR